MSVEFFAAGAIATWEKLLAIAEREKVITGITTLVGLVVTVVVIVASWSIWIPGMVGFVPGWFAARYFRARRHAKEARRTLVRLHEIGGR